MKIKLKSLFVLIILFAGSLFAQTCGFGCLGLSGAFGGYTYQSYETEGLNLYAKNTLGLNDSFGNAKGFRAGGNIVRAKFDGYFFTIKGFYQFSSEEKEVISASLQDVRNTYELKANYWGVGLDIGIPVLDFMDFKILDGGITFQQTDYEERQISGTGEIAYKKYENEDSDIGYYVGSGLIFHLVQDYVSLEGSAYYNMMSVSNLIDESGNKLLNEDSPDLISKGGLSLIVQLNIGFPL
ncbi:MAG: hypothetical protein ACEPO8_09930 [Rhodothermaceae bacterium]